MFEVAITLLTRLNFIVITIHCLNTDFSKTFPFYTLSFGQITLGALNIYFYLKFKQKSMRTFAHDFF